MGYWKNFARFEGRATRREFWGVIGLTAVFMFLVLLISVFLNVIGALLPIMAGGGTSKPVTPGNMFLTVLWILFALPVTAALARRFSDANFPMGFVAILPVAWLMVWIGIVPVGVAVGLIGLLCLLAGILPTKAEA